MISRRPALGSQLGSVALRYQTRTASVWRPARGSRQHLAPTPPVEPVKARGGPGRRDRLTATVEAALFVASEPLTSRRLAQVAGLDDPTQARTLIRRLNEHYRASDSAFFVEEVAGGWQLLTHPSFGGWLRRLHPSGSGLRLSAPAMETLAVVAYRQPVVRAEIEAIRGVQCGEMLRQLMDRDLVRIVGKSNDLGRPFLYGTTPRFLRTFGLRALEDLPRAEQLRAAPSTTTAPERTKQLDN